MHGHNPRLRKEQLFMTQSDFSAVPPPPPPPVNPAPEATTATPTPPPTVNYASSTPGTGFPDALKANLAAMPDLEKKLAIAGAAGYLLILISTFLPWISIHIFGESQSFAGIKTGPGKFILLLCLGAIGYVVYGITKPATRMVTWMILAAGGAMMFIWHVVLLIRLKHAFGPMTGGPSGEMGAAMSEMFKDVVSTGFGLWMGVIVSLIPLAAYSILHSPDLTRGKPMPHSNTLFVALGAGAVAGLLFGFIS
jgi:hypothetical protein